MRAAVALVAACLALAALTLLAPSSPSYDPFAWIVWGRELMPGADGPPFGLAGGPSWKPLPVLFTTLFSLAGDAAPALWLLVARTGLLLALAGAFALAARLAAEAGERSDRAMPVLAGLTAAVAVLLLADLVSLAWRGASEPLLLACLLWAGERHLAGRRRTAFALGVAAALMRPEIVPFLALYALVLWRAAPPGERIALVGGLALIVLLWIGIPGVAGDPFAASTTARNPSTRTGAASALRGDLGLALAIVWVLACVGVALRARMRAVQTLALGAVAWLALLAAMAASGYASPARYAMPAAACACVLAGVGVAALLEQRRREVVAIALAVCAALAAPRLATLDDQVRDGTAVARSNEQLRTAVDAAGGTVALRRCALGGWVAVNHTTQSALAWELKAGLDRVARTMSRPGVLVRAPRSEAAGAPPAVTLKRPLRAATVARAGAWTVLAVRSDRTPLPHACSGQKASGRARRIPNI
jgi:hypothetical protein